MQPSERGMGRPSPWGNKRPDFSDSDFSSGGGFGGGGGFGSGGGSFGNSRGNFGNSRRDDFCDRDPWSSNASAPSPWQGGIDIGGGSWEDQV
jgi:hypothetical protein